MSRISLNVVLHLPPSLFWKSTRRYSTLKRQCNPNVKNIATKILSPVYKKIYYYNIIDVIFYKSIVTEKFKEQYFTTDLVTTKIINKI
jgi:hypothetical protein